MIKIIIIIPYFGKLPPNFDLWMLSVSFNKTIDFVLLTDDYSSFEFPANMKVVYTSFDEVKQKIQNLYDFRILLTQPYKLCDFRVAYGDIFKEYINGYDFWGYCDLDIMFGSIRNFLSESVLNNYERIGWLGHFSIYKNCEKLNQLYRQDYKGEVLFKKAFCEKRNTYFDEIGINMLCDWHNIKVFKGLFFADLTPLTYNFRLSHYVSIYKQPGVIFRYCKGMLKSIRMGEDAKVLEKEYMYVHFLRRRMKNKLKDVSGFYIVPNSFLNCSRGDSYVYNK